MDSPRALSIDLRGRAIEAMEWPGSPGAPIVLLHEGLGSVGLWRGFPQQLQEASGRRIVAYSRFGHGGSDPPPAPRGVDVFREEALNVFPLLLRHLDAHAPILVGHSDGASIALVHAAHFKVTGLVLIAPHVFVEPITVDAIRATKRRFEAQDLRGRLDRHHADPDLAFRGWADVWLDPDFARWSLSPEIRALAAPTLLIQSGNDPYGSVAQLNRIESGSRARIETVICGKGHVPHLEEPAAVVAAIERFSRVREQERLNDS
jgi:pimeloyl-ACP methyl ester carboxylesterase